MLFFLRVYLAASNNALPVCQKMGKEEFVLTYFCSKVWLSMQNMSIPCIRVRISQMPQVQRVMTMERMPAMTLPR